MNLLSNKIFLIFFGVEIYLFSLERIWGDVTLTPRRPRPRPPIPTKMPPPPISRSKKENLSRLTVLFHCGLITISQGGGIVWFFWRLDQESSGDYFLKGVGLDSIMVLMGKIQEKMKICQ